MRKTRSTRFLPKEKSLEERNSFPHHGVLIKAVNVAALCCCLCTLAPAQKNRPTRVWDSILGVRIGSTLEEARERLRGLGTLGGEKDAKMDEADDEERHEGGRKGPGPRRKASSRT